MKKYIKKIAYNLGYDIKRIQHVANNNIPYDIKADKIFLELYNECNNYTMTSIERMYALYMAVKYVIKNNIKGDFVETGVWRGGSSMMILLTLKKMGITDKYIYMYDTFEGMVAPTKKDVDYKNNNASALLDNAKKDKELDRSIWCYCPIDDVKKNIASTNYPEDKIIYVKGDVRDTIPDLIPENIALLRMDTDFYESSNHEINHLFPILTGGGVLILDDYGHWQGQREAIDRYFKKNKISNFLNRIDGTGRLLIK